jgi:hypothetical protein
VSIGVAVAGVIAAGLGLATMSFAFKPLPKPGVPVVISTSAPMATAASFRHIEPQALPPVAEPARKRHAKTTRVAIHRKHADPDRAAEAKPVLVPVHATAPAAAPAPTPAAKPVVQVAKLDASGEKLCKAPQPQLLSAKTLEPAMILRYDAKKIRPLEIQPPQPPPADDTERRLKLSALLANMLSN